LLLVIERQSKKTDERDSGVDDVDSQPRVKTRRSMPNVDKSGACLILVGFLRFLADFLLLVLMVIIASIYIPCSIVLEF